MRKRIYPEELLNIFNEEERRLAKEFKISSKYELSLYCEKHGEYRKRIESICSLTRGKMTGSIECPQCVRERLLNDIRESKLESFTVPEEIIEVMVDDEQKKLARQHKIRMRDKIKIKCNIHGEFERPLYYLYSRKEDKVITLCPWCGHSRGNKTRWKAERPEYPQWFLDELVRDEDKERALSRDLGTKDRILLRCKNGHVYESTPNQRIRLTDGTPRYGCLRCAEGNHKSLYEEDIAEWLSSIEDGIRIERNIRGLIGGKKEIDIYLPDYNLGIEFNGSWYHQTGDWEYGKDKLYHQNKFISSKENNIHLIQIFDVDWFEKEQKIKGFIKSCLGKDERIYARDCSIEYDLDIKDFLNKYHMQGNSVLGKRNICLVYDGNIISCLSYGEGRYKEKRIEIYRYAIKEGYTVIGGAERLFKHLLDSIDKNIICYSDNDFFTGGVYSRLGFRLDGYTDPSYYWVKPNGTDYRTREQCQLKNLRVRYRELYEKVRDMQGNKEELIMRDMGYIQVHRSGNTRWLYDL